MVYLPYQLVSRISEPSTVVQTIRWPMFQNHILWDLQIHDFTPKQREIFIIGSFHFPGTSLGILHKTKSWQKTQIACLILSLGKTSWWFQPLLKNISQIGSLPQIGVTIKDIWNHHPEKSMAEKKTTTTSHFFSPTKKTRDHAAPSLDLYVHVPRLLTFRNS